MTRRAIWLPLGLIVAVALAVAGVFWSGEQASAQVAATADVEVGTVTVAPNAIGRVDITVSPTAGLIGAVEFTVDYDSALVSPAAAGPPAAGVPALPETADQCYNGVDDDADTVADDGCTACSSPFGVCNSAVDPITFALASVAPGGIFGTAGTIFFQAGATEVTDSPLVLAVSVCADDIGDPATCTEIDGSITIQVPPTPSPTPVATATPVPTATAVPATATPTPAGLPSTGATDPTDGSGSSALPLLLAAMGIAALTAGAWAVTRLRRVQA